MTWKRWTLSQSFWMTWQAFGPHPLRMFGGAMVLVPLLLLVTRCDVVPPSPVTALLHGSLVVWIEIAVCVTGRWLLTLFTFARGAAPQRTHDDL